VLLYGYCLGVRSSRQFERRCTEDIAFRVLAADQAPDHVTIARFRVRHEQALAGFLVESLKLCAVAGRTAAAGSLPQIKWQRSVDASGLLAMPQLQRQRTAARTLYRLMSVVIQSEAANAVTCGASD
jgi:Transposase domain (DUF772)